jgi:hypothetical protein
LMLKLIRSRMHVTAVSKAIHFTSWVTAGSRESPI